MSFDINPFMTFPRLNLFQSNPAATLAAMPNTAPPRNHRHRCGFGAAAVAVSAVSTTVLPVSQTSSYAF